MVLAVIDFLSALLSQITVYIYSTSITASTLNKYLNYLLIHMTCMLNSFLQSMFDDMFIVFLDFGLSATIVANYVSTSASKELFN